MRALLLALFALCTAFPAAAKPYIRGPAYTPPPASAQAPGNQPPVQAPSWAQLSPKQQADLDWLARDWDHMESENSSGG